MSIPENDLWRDIFATYQNEACLWNTNDINFSNKHFRALAWEKLLEKYKRIDKNANMDTIKQKIHNIRSCYRRELKKIRDSLRSAGGIHYPSLWYFELLEFLRDHKMPKKNSSMTVSSVKGNRQGAKKSKMPQEKADVEIPHLKSVERKDETVIYAESWACSFSKLSPMQQIYAKQAIEEILIRGRLQQLTLNYLPPM